MSIRNFSSIPYGKTGEGNFWKSYGRYSYTMLEPIIDRTLQLVKSIPFINKKAVFNIGDYGAADGSTSMVFIRNLIMSLKEQHGPDVEFQVIFEDQEINDFNSLFSCLSGKLPDLPPYLLEMDNVFPLASGINFRKQCVPSDSMHFIMSIAAVHWLSRNPVMYTESVDTYPDITAEEKEALYNQAQVDWETFLLMRSRELKSGGILLTISFGEYVDQNGRIMFFQKNFLHLLTDIWKSFRDSGRITKDEFISTNFAGCWYNLNQLKAPFEDKNSSVSKSGLHLIFAEVAIAKCVIFNAWKEKKEKEGIDDRQGFAQTYVAAHRTWSNNTFLRGLSDDRSQKEKEEIVEDLYSLVEENVCKMDPSKFKNDNIFSYVIIGKKDQQ